MRMKIEDSDPGVAQTSEEKEMEEFRQSLFGKDRLVWENDTYAFYSTGLTRDCTKHARAMDIHGMELRGWAVVMAKGKISGVPDTSYVLYNEKGMPVFDAPTIWEVHDRIDLIKIAITEDYNIVNIAEKLREGEDE